jgi:hypothetical protein
MTFNYIFILKHHLLALRKIQNTFIPDRNHHDSEQQQRSGTPINLIDMDMVDEVECTPSFHSSNVSTPSFSAEQRMQNKFDAVSRQLDDMFNTFQMQISAMTKQALDRFRLPAKYNDLVS